MYAVGDDKWLRSNDVIVGYAQSWALVHMLMKENPAKFAKFLRGIYRAAYAFEQASKKRVPPASTP